MKNSEIFTLAHKTAKELTIEASYAFKLSFALRFAHKAAKLEPKLDAATVVTFWSNQEIHISSGVCSIDNVAKTSSGLVEVETINVSSVIHFSETESQKFTRLAIEKYNNLKAA